MFIALLCCSNLPWWLFPGLSSPVGFYSSLKLAVNLIGRWVLLKAVVRRRQVFASVPLESINEQMKCISTSFPAPAPVSFSSLALDLITHNPSMRREGFLCLEAPACRFMAFLHCLKHIQWSFLCGICVGGDCSVLRGSTLRAPLS